MNGASIIFLTQNNYQQLDSFFSNFLKVNIHEPVEFIIIDHGSTDSTPNIVSRYSSKAFIRLINRSANHSPESSANLGAKKSENSSLLFLSPHAHYPDDFYTQILNTEPDAKEGIIFNISLFDKSNPHLRSYHQSLKDILLEGIVEIENRALPNYRFGNLGNILFCKKDDFNKLGGFSNEYRQRAELGLVDEDGRMGQVRSDYRQAYETWHRTEGTKKLSPHAKEQPFQAPKTTQISKAGIGKVLTVKSEKSPAKQPSDPDMSNTKRVLVNAYEIAKTGDHARALAEAHQPADLDYTAHVLHANAASSQDRHLLTYNKFKKCEFYKSITKEILAKLETSTTINIELKKVSIVVPTHNGMNYIEETLKSLLSQSYANIEVIVIDDASNDDTFSVVKKISDIDNRVRIYKLATRMGRYFAISYGISVSTGTYVTFNQSDEYSHELTIALYLSEAFATYNDVIVTNCRLTSSKNDRIEKEIFEHYEYSSIFIKRCIFSQIGTFDLTKIGGYTELIKRIELAYGDNYIKYISCPTHLSLQLVTENDLVGYKSAFDKGTSALSFSYKKYISNAETQQHLFELSDFCKIFSFPMLRSPYNHSSLTKCSALDEYLVYGCMCTIPSRRFVLLRAFNSIIRQVDKLFIYPDMYEVDLHPDIMSHPKVVVLSNREFPNFAAAGKFLPLIKGMFEDVIDKVIYFTFDDDIEYPPEYVHALSKALLNHSFHAIVGVHGSILNDGFENYRKNRTVFNFKNALTDEVIVDVIGTGTVAFKASILKNKIFDSDLYPKMVDISLARVCRRNSIPIICISRPNEWLIDMTPDINNNDDSIWNNTVVNNAALHTKALLEYGVESWGYSGIKKLISKRCIQLKNTTTQQVAVTLEENGFPLLLHLYFASNGTYKVAISTNTAIYTNKKIFVNITNSVSNKVLMHRNIVKGAASFTLDSTLNKVITLDFVNLLHRNLRSADISLSVEFLYPEARPREFLESPTLIHAALATYPPREHLLIDIINSVAHNVDNLCLYLNRYQRPPEVIIEAINHKEVGPGIHYVIDNDGHPKASGKFRWVKKEGYIFTLDDDIIYPNDYFKVLINWIEKFHRRAFVGVHGRLFNEYISTSDKKVKGYVREKFNFGDEVVACKRVHLIGTGTLAYHSSLISEFADRFYHQMNLLPGSENSNDEALALFTKQNNIPMYIVPRKKGWLKSNPKMIHGIHEEHFGDPSLAKVTRMLLSSGNPWVSPENLDSSIICSSSSKKSVCVVFPTYNRPYLMRRLLSQLNHAAENIKLTVLVFDDGSSPSASIDWSRYNNIKFGKLFSFQNHGKQRYWYLVNIIFSYAQNVCADYYFYLGDDLQVSKSFFNDSIRAWNAIDDDKKITLNLLNDGREVCWTDFKRKIVNYQGMNFYLSQWVDMIMMFSTHLLAYKIEKIPTSRWGKNPLRSSGVGAQLSQRLLRDKWNMYQVVNSLVFHGNHESEMNPEERRINSLTTTLKCQTGLHLF